MEEKYVTKAEMAGRKCQMGSFGCTSGCNGEDRNGSSNDYGYTRKEVTFGQAFKELPTVLVAVKKNINNQGGDWGGYDVYAEKVKTTGFTGVIEIIDTVYIEQIDAVWI